MADFKFFTTPEGVLTVEALTPSEGALVWMRVRRGLGEVSISTANGCLYKGRAWPTVSLQDVRVWPDLAAFRADPDGTPLGDLFRALDASKASIAADLCPGIVGSAWPTMARPL